MNTNQHQYLKKLHEVRTRLEQKHYKAVHDLDSKYLDYIRLILDQQQNIKFKLKQIYDNKLKSIDQLIRSLNLEVRDAKNKSNCNNNKRTVIKAVATVHKYNCIKKDHINLKPSAQIHDQSYSSKNTNTQPDNTNINVQQKASAYPMEVPVLGYNYKDSSSIDHSNKSSYDVASVSDKHKCSDGEMEVREQSQCGDTNERYNSSNRLRSLSIDANDNSSYNNTNKCNKYGNYSKYSKENTHSQSLQAPLKASSNYNYDRGNRKFNRVFNYHNCDDDSGNIDMNLNKSNKDNINDNYNNTIICNEENKICSRSSSIDDKIEALSNDLDTGKAFNLHDDDNLSLTKPGNYKESVVLSSDGDTTVSMININNCDDKSNSQQDACSNIVNNRSVSSFTTPPLTAPGRVPRLISESISANKINDNVNINTNKTKKTKILTTKKSNCNSNSNANSNFMIKVGNNVNGKKKNKKYKNKNKDNNNDMNRLLKNNVNKPVKCDQGTLKLQPKVMHKKTKEYHNYRHKRIGDAYTVRSKSGDKSYTYCNVFNDSGVTKYQCRFANCDKIYWHRSTAYNHYISKHTTRYQCRFCKICFSSSGQLQIHARKHTGEKPIQCKYCEKRFVSKEACDQHEKIHIKKVSMLTNMLLNT